MCRDTRSLPGGLPFPVGTNDPKTYWHKTTTLLILIVLKVSNSVRVYQIWFVCAPQCLDLQRGLFKQLEIAGVAPLGLYVWGLGSSPHVMSWGWNIRDDFCTPVSGARAGMAGISGTGHHFSFSMNGSLRVVGLLTQHLLLFPRARERKCGSFWSLTM